MNRRLIGCPPSPFSEKTSNRCAQAPRPVRGPHTWPSEAAYTAARQAPRPPAQQCEITAAALRGDGCPEPVRRARPRDAAARRVAIRSLPGAVLMRSPERVRAGFAGAPVGARRAHVDSSHYWRVVVGFRGAGFGLAARPDSSRLWQGSPIPRKRFLMRLVLLCLANKY